MSPRNSWCSIPFLALATLIACFLVSFVSAYPTPSIFRRQDDNITTPSTIHGELNGVGYNLTLMGSPNATDPVYRIEGGYQKNGMYLVPAILKNVTTTSKTYRSRLLEYTKKGGIWIDNNMPLLDNFFIVVEDVRVAYKNFLDLNRRLIGELRPYDEWNPKREDLEAHASAYINLVREYLTYLMEKKGILYRNINISHFFVNDVLSFVVAINWSPEEDAEHPGVVSITSLNGNHSQWETMKEDYVKDVLDSLAEKLLPGVNVNSTLRITD